MRPDLPVRPPDGHKGTFGTVVVIGGTETMIGAPAMAATAALRTGCGLARIMTWPAVLPYCLTVEPSATGMAVPYLDDPMAVQQAMAELPERTVLAVGPGMSQRQVARRAVEVVLTCPFPVVLDAGGLNNLAELGRRIARPRCPLVLTPHPGEYGRLAAAASIDLDPTDPQQRPEAALALARRYGAVVVLKGRHTVIAEGDRVAINTTGNPALATAGTGDVLTGAIASLIAQGLAPFEAAVLGAHLHGLAADLWVRRHGPVGLLARELAGWLPRAIAAYGRHPAGPAPVAEDVA